MRDGYPQILYIDKRDGTYTFQRLITKIDLYDTTPELIIGVADDRYPDGIHIVEWFSKARKPGIIKRYIEKYKVTF